MPTWLIVMLIVIILGASSAWLVFLARFEYDRLPEREMMCTKCGKTFYPEKNGLRRCSAFINTVMLNVRIAGRKVLCLI